MAQASTDEGDRVQFARRGAAAYEKYVKPHMSSGDTGRFVALDVDTGDYELDDDKLGAIRRLRDRRPGVVGWLVRVGYPYVDRVGWGVATPTA